MKEEPIALLLNDLHVNKDNIQEFESNWDEALRICEKYAIYDMVVGGDVFTDRASQTLPVLMSVKNALLKASNKKITVTIAEGNHDKVDKNSEDGYNHLWAGMKDVDVVDSHRALYWDDCDFVLLVMSYFDEKSSFLARLKTAVEDTVSKFKPSEISEKDIILYIHEGVHGALGNLDIEGELPQEPLKPFKAVLCGHYHNRVKIKGTNIEYIGSSRQHNFGEDEEKGYTVLCADGSYEFIKNSVNTRYATIELDASEVGKFKLEKKPGYRYRMKIKCTDKEASLVDRQKLFDAGFSKVEISQYSEDDKVVRSSMAITDKYDMHGIKKEYVAYCKEKNIDSRLGIHYLEGADNVENI